MDQNNGNFMDSRTMWAILLVGLVWFGWQKYINEKYGKQQVTHGQSNVSNGDQEGAPVKENSLGKNIEEKATETPEMRLSFSNRLMAGYVSSRGMSLRDITLTEFKGRDALPIRFSGGENGILATRVAGKTVDFKIEQPSVDVFYGVAEVNGIKLKKKFQFLPGYKVDMEISMEGMGSLPPLELSLEDDLKKAEGGGIFSPTVDSQEVFALNSEGEKEFKPDSEKNGISATVGNAILASLNGHYFSAAFIDKSDLAPSLTIEHRVGDSYVKGNLIYSPGSNKGSLVVKGLAYIGPKDIGLLEAADPQLLKMVKFGFFSTIAKPLLLTMKWLNGILGNWGWSIIVLTLLVRMVVMPLHIMSFRSMKSMQRVQPLIQSLRERYKDDPMSLNREMMALMKKHKVNPMGGCLPMLLQIPVFFALYRVFSESIELYQAPFIFWIHDLSSKDPFYVLPILMALVMYIQQKITPSTMDPAQAKVMQFMPLIFSFMMISLPSALTLYMFVSTFFGILQQYLFLKDKNATAVAV